MKIHLICATAVMLLSCIDSSLSAPLPQKIGTCTQSFVKEISYRLSSPDSNGVYIPVPDSGSVISFTNGGSQVSYDNIHAIYASREGDAVRTCLTFIPDCSHAKAGDTRGRVYLTTNLRTGSSWELPDSQHQCGGA